MANVIVENNKYTVESLYQWDLNQVLEIYGLSLESIPEIHFTNNAMDRAIVKQSTMDDNGVIRVTIPNSLLQTPYKITAYVCTYEGSAFKSLYKIVIPVEARNKPNDYTLSVTDDEVYSFNALENKIENELTLARKIYEDSVRDFLLRSGDKMSGAIDMGGFKITRLGTPTADSDAVPKVYADLIARAAAAAQTSADNANTAAGNAQTSADNANTAAANAQSAAENAQTTADNAVPKDTLPYFRTYSFKQDTEAPWHNLIVNNWTDITVGTVFLARIQAGGTMAVGVGIKVNDNYGAYILFTYAMTTPTYYKKTGGTWSESAL